MEILTNEALRDSLKNLSYRERRGVEPLDLDAVLTDLLVVAPQAGTDRIRDTSVF